MGVNVFDRARRNIVAGILVASMVLSIPASAFASITPPSIKAKSAILMTMDGRKVWSHRSTTRRQVASTIKMLNALVVRESVNLTEVVVVPRKAAAINDGDVGLVKGQRLTVHQLLKMMLIASANDAAEALAIHIAGSEKAYVALMNAKAKELKLKGTHAIDPHGLSERETSTARDLTVLARKIMKDPVLRAIVKTRSVKVPRPGKKARTFASTNLLLGNYKGIEGVKTGYTSNAGYCFVGAAKRGGVELLGVVLHTSSLKARFAQMRKLLDWGFKHIHMQRLVSAETTMGAVAIDGFPLVTVTVHAARETSMALYDAGGPIETTVSLPATVAAPVARGQRLGSVYVSRDGSKLATVALLADTTVTVSSLASPSYTAVSLAR
jgi:D-alanyl-D-alanine carboxypeptidase (penicillin-binding protein 5/6)